ncbi:MAG: Crp/Fnr family transcriptional regulator [Bacteroidales bacterium]|nr:Crp/Fnr family transcriptional regulator [Bacteroidales bacterium]
MSDNNKSLFRDHSKISPCLSQISEADLEYLDTMTTQLTYYQGENLFKQGAFAPYVLYVIDGMVKIYLQTGYDKQLNIRLAITGDFLAFSAVFGSSVYNYSSQALMDTRVFMIDKEALKEVLLRNPLFAMQITSINYRNEETLLSLIENLSYKQMRGKLATALLYLSSEEFLKLNIFRHLTRQEIADFAAVTTESAIKLLKEFEREGIIELEGKDIGIVDFIRLEEISRKG